MPELPDVTVYVERIESLAVGHELKRIRIAGPFLLRSVEPPLKEFEGRTLRSVRRLGKRLVFGFDGDLFLVLHLMIAGRLHWRDPGAKLGEAAFDFDHGTLILTEAGTKKRASLHAVRGGTALKAHDPGGLEVADAPFEAFRLALTREVHTLKRALTDPRLFSGIGNAYSDEILHRARLSPFKRTDRLDDEEITRLHEATRATLAEWLARLRAAAGGGLPEGVTAFREGMAVHGRYKKPCPVCRAPIQRIRYAENETNYCPRCQTEGKILADRSMSRLLKGDWPGTIEELEQPSGGSQTEPRTDTPPRRR